MYECCPPDVVEIGTVPVLLDHIQRVGDVRSVVLQGLDLTDESVETALLNVDAEDACFLGCRLSDRLESHLHASGATVFPAFAGIPFHPYRSHLYTPDELMEGYTANGDVFADTVDGAIYRYFTDRRGRGRDVPVMDALAFRIHDHAIDDALQEVLHPSDAPARRVVGVMGGHQLLRSDATYRSVMDAGWRLARDGFFVATGGGPGAMEAANLGASLASYDADALDDAHAHLSAAPHYNDDGYVDAAYEVRDRYPSRTESLAVPTWFYGHEPSNLFATHIAKYFANSIREDGLLAIATHGVIYAPGSAGTIQEVFMDAAQNHYETFGDASPMVFVGSAYWTETKPVYPLVKSLSEGTPYEGLTTLTDDVDAVVDVIRAHAEERASV